MSTPTRHICVYTYQVYVSMCVHVCVYMCPLCTHVYANVPCVAVYFRVLQCVAVCCRVLQCLTVSSVLKCVTVCSSAVQCAAVRRIHICAPYNPSNPTPPPPATPARCRRHAYRVARTHTHLYKVHTCLPCRAHQHQRWRRAEAVLSGAGR